MARSHRLIPVRMWRDPEFAALAMDSQRLFIVLLSQPDLNPRGVIPLRPQRWARLSTSTSIRDVLQALDELGERRFISVDLDNQDVTLLPPPQWSVNGPSDPRWTVFEKDGWACVECASTFDLTVDHIHPQARGGVDDPANLRTLCRPCNSRKGARI